MVLDNKALKKITVPKKEKVAEGWRKLRARSFIICAIHHVLFVLFYFFYWSHPDVFSLKYSKSKFSQNTTNYN